jgi:uncharacterized HAD superfamily protein/hypoxanthine phosphoribosyltransferase
MNYETYTSLSKIINKNLDIIRNYNFDLIVGIPRSGMIPAYMIALSLNLSCCNINELINNSELKVGQTRKVKKQITYAYDAKKILIVDDSISSGNTLKSELSKIPNEILKKIKTLAVYSTEKKRNDVDIFLKFLSSPRVFEWNIFHHSIVLNSGFDLDGVLCIDPTESQNDDGERYKEFLLSVKPLNIPSQKINTIITSRLEKYRSETEAWLRNNGVEYDKLLMLDLPDKETRIKLAIHAKFKAENYKKLGLHLFFESSLKQAIEINKLTKKPVYCIENNEMINNENVVNFIHSPNQVKKQIIFSKTPKLIKKIWYFFRK